MKKLFFCLMISFASVFAQIEQSNAEYVNQIPFNADVALFKSSVPGKTRVDIYVQVPYSSIQFTKKDNVFSASYNVTLSFYDSTKQNIVFDQNWNEKVTTADFKETLTRSNFNLSYKNFDLARGRMTLRCSIEDNDSRKYSFKEIPIAIRAINDTLGISDLIFISETIKDSAGQRIIPNISNTVNDKSNSLSFYFDVYSNKKRDVSIEYTLYDNKRNSSLKQDEQKTLNAGAALLTYTFRNMTFSIGDYTLRIVLKDKSGREAASTEKKLISKIYGVPVSITDLDKSISEMIYIASPEELDYIKDGTTYDERLGRFLAFWNKKNPNPKSESNPVLAEYYRRVDYANKNFKGFGEGWRSDMGMIYVTFGPPDNVERHPMDSDSKPYEIWVYYELDRSFVFMDKTGFGDYRLVNPDFGRWPGYRE